MGLKMKILIVALPFLIMAFRKYNKGDYYEGTESMEGKTVIVTGANAGIGLGTAIGLAKRKAKVILACRNTKKGEAAIKKIREATKEGALVLKHLNLASFESIRKFAKDVNKNEAKLDVLINNAGVFDPPPGKTEDGLDMILGTNHFGTFLLTNLLLDKIKSTPKSRIVTVTSDAHKFVKTIDFNDLNFEKEDYGFMPRYATSKLANCLFSKELGKRLDGTDIGTSCAHPGLVATELFDHLLSKLPSILNQVASAYLTFFHKGIWEGAQTSIYCAVAKEMDGVRGKYYKDIQETDDTNPALHDEKLAAKLWDISEEITGLK